jgi:predicted HD superfamily hydrolase involved in NAD metabolism
MMHLSDIKAIIKDSVSEGRYLHILRVADTARKLAEFWGVDGDKAYLAGILHDAAKRLSPNDIMALGITLDDYLDDVFNEYPKVWHALISDVYCLHRFGIEDTDVLDASKWHTTGKANMSILAQIIFIADYIEPERGVKPRAYIETLAYRHLGQAVFALSTVSLHHLLIQGWAFHPNTVECRNFYLNQLPPDMVKLVIRDISQYL